MTKKEINMDIDDPRAGDIAEVISNKTCKKIISAVAESNEGLSESEIAAKLGMPMNTVNYNIKKLVKSGLIESDKRFLWSVKGKRIYKYKLANKKIVIMPKVNATRVLAGVIGILAVAFIVMMVVFWNPNRIELPGVSDELQRFGSEGEIKAFLEESVDDGGFFGGVVGREESATMDFAESGGAPSAATAGEKASDYSETNVQVQGVDEPDIVKNDGKYIYVVSGKKVSIIDAYPAEDMEVLSEIEFDDYTSNIFVNGDRLIVFVQEYEYLESGIRCDGVLEIGIPCGGYSKQTAVVKIYDISDRENPELEDEVKVSGNYIDARMIDDYVYLISNKYVSTGFVQLPEFESDGVVTKVSASEIYYFDSGAGNYVFNTVSAINVRNGDVESETYLMDYSGTIYVSEKNIYLTYMKSLSQKYYFEKFVDDVVLEVLPVSEGNDVEEIMDGDGSLSEKRKEVGKVVEEYMGELEQEELAEFLLKYQELQEDFYSEVQKETEMTVVHKISVDGNEIDYQEMGEVPGRVLNQFSIDEFEGNLRIATTTGGWRGDDNLNHLYVLDEDMDIIGSVEDLAKGERIYSARSMGERAYMVTFRQVDPLFVIDLSEPENPEVLGYLKVTGFSNYLQPYDSTHILGIGKEADENGIAGELKISLFDVSDVANPVESAKYVVNTGRWSYSEALYEHKAILFDNEKELLVLPVSYSEGITVAVDSADMPGRTITNYRYWQGAYVFDVSLDGISLKGKVAHEENETEQGYWYGGDNIRRSLYMDDVLYTVSNKVVKASALSDLDEISSVTFSSGEDYWYGGFGVAPGIAE